MRPISVEGFEPRRVDDVGPAPMLQWIKVADLVVDPAYQRPILGEGRRNVERIAQHFRWAYFAPVVVAPVEGGRFAIIDGQHRTTAAALIGIEMVPCQVVTAERNEQAAAFKAINGSTTAISRMALHAAALIAREPRAVEIAEVCSAAEVELLRYPVPTDRQAPGQTMAIAAIDSSLKRHGRQVVTRGLKCIMRSAGERPGVLSARMIKAVCELVSERSDTPFDEGRLLAEFEALDLVAIEQASALIAAERRIGRVSAIVEELRRALGVRQFREAAE
jgi:hypothetical protein